jgi:hypothetical protein
VSIGEQLKQTEELRRQERVTRRSDMLRKFVKEDLLNALTTQIDKGGNDYAPVLAPKEIRHLFAAPLDAGYKNSHSNPQSPYNAVWRELDAWAASENLFIRTGHSMGNNNRGGIPWDNLDWGGSLGIRVPKPEPVKPTPPAPQVVKKGISFPTLIIGTMAVILGLILVALGAFK